MSKKRAQTPLDLSLFDDLAPPGLDASHAVVPTPTAVTDPRLLEQAPQPRLVEVEKLKPDERQAPELSAARIDFRNTASVLSQGEGIFGEIAQSSRQLLSGVRLGDAGQIGDMAAAVIDGIKILRIQDLQAEANDGAGLRPKGLVGRLLRSVGEARSAFDGFAESR